MDIEIKDIQPIEGNGVGGAMMFDSRIQAGFPSPAQGLFGDAIDLNRALIDSPSSTFCARVTGDSMIDAGIGDGDLLIIDKAMDVTDGCIAVCFVDGEFTVKRLTVTPEGVMLVAANRRYPAIRISADTNFQVWGVVTHVIKDVRRQGR